MLLELIEEIERISETGLKLDYIGLRILRDHSSLEERKSGKGRITELGF